MQRAPFVGLLGNLLLLALQANQLRARVALFFEPVGIDEAPFKSTGMGYCHST